MDADRYLLRRHYHEPANEYCFYVYDVLVARLIKDEVAAGQLSESEAAMAPMIGTPSHWRAHTQSEAHKLLAMWVEGETDATT